jgi:hypothetical protein
MAKTQILDLLRKGDFAAAHTELAELGSECVLNPGDYSLQAAYADLQDCVAYYVRQSKTAAA